MKRLNNILTVFSLILVFNSNNSFSQWIQTSGPAGAGVIFTLAVRENNIFAGTKSGGVYLSTDNGLSWEKRNNGIGNIWVMALAIKDTNIIGGTYSYGIQRSTDNGLNWTQVNWTGEHTDALLVLGNYIFAGQLPVTLTAGGGVRRSSDNGITWERFLTGLPYPPEVQTLANISNNLFLATYNEGVFISTDYGESWEKVNDGLPANSCRCSRLISSGDNLFVGTRGYGIYRSTNNGLDWIAVNDGLPTDAVIGAFGVIGNNIFAGTSDSPEWTPRGIYLSTNNGEDWSAVNTGLPPNTNIKSIAIKDSLIFIGTAYEGGVWYRPLSELITDVEAEVSEFPNEYKLEQNYPNPFNPTTTISFSILQSQNLELKVFDVLGNEMATLLNEYKEAGEHKVELDGSDLTSGIYFYRLKAGGSVQTKKMVLMK